MVVPFAQSLDIQYTVGIATGVPNTFISVGDTANGITPDKVLEMASALLQQETVPLVLSISFGGNEVPQLEGFTQLAVYASRFLIVYSMV